MSSAKENPNPYKVLLHYSWPYATAYTIMLSVFLLGGGGFYLAWTVSAVLIIMASLSWFTVGTLCFLYLKSLYPDLFTRKRNERERRSIPHDDLDIERSYSAGYSGQVPTPQVEAEYPLQETL